MRAWVGGQLSVGHKFMNTAQFRAHDMFWVWACFLFSCSVSLVCGTCMACLCESATCVHGCLTPYTQMYTCLCYSVVSVCVCAHTWVGLTTVTLISQRYVQSCLKNDDVAA